MALAEPDGYTLLATPSVPMTINKYLYKDMSFEPTKLSSVIMMASVPNGIAARIDFPANNVKELIAYSQSNPGKVSFGSQGNSSTSHLKGQMFASMVGTAPTQQALVFDSVNETISPAIKQKLSWIETRIKITINKV